jgi:hypothetical protein
MVARVALSTAKRGAHDDAHDAFMTLPAYTSAREDEVRQPGRGQKPCRLGLCMRKCPQGSYTDSQTVLSKPRRGGGGVGWSGDACIAPCR